MIDTMDNLAKTFAMSASELQPWSNDTQEALDAHSGARVSGKKKGEEALAQLSGDLTSGIKNGDALAQHSGDVAPAVKDATGSELKEMTDRAQKCLASQKAGAAPTLDEAKQMAHQTRSKQGRNFWG